MTSYEWVAEWLTPSGDVDEVNFYDRKQDALGAGADQVALTRRVDCEHDGLIDRGYAYLDCDGMEGGRLPVEFDNGYPVPWRYRASS